MKSVIKTILIMVVMFTAGFNYAGDFSHVVKKEEHKLSPVNLGKMEKGAVVLIKDHHGLIVYRELIKRSGMYSRDFDLTSLPDGNYYFELDKQSEIKVIPFKVRANSVIFNKEGAITINKPSVTVKGDYVYISKLSLEKKPMEIEIYYNGYELIHSEELKDAQHLGRIYDFSGAIEGNYEIVLKTEGRRFTKNIKF